MAKKKGDMRCEPWCRHWFRLDGESVCTFSGDNFRTEKGAPCMGRRERTFGGEKKDYAAAPGGVVVKKKWVKKPDDPYCRRECEYFIDGVCHYGTELCVTEDGARCMGKKKIPQKKKTD